MRFDPNQTVHRHLLGLRDYAYTYALGSLRREKSVAKAQKINDKLNSTMDTEFEKISEAFEKENQATRIACKTGCAFCCMQQSFVSVPELFSLYHAYCALDEDKKASIVAKLRAYEPKWLAHKAKNPNLLFRVMCPLNDLGMCQVYQNRPSTCRSFNSFDVKRCEEVYLTESDEVAVLGSALYTQVGRQFRTGFALAMEDEGLSTQMYDMSPALLYVIDHPEMLDQILNDPTTMPEYVLKVEEGWLETERRVFKLPIV